MQDYNECRRMKVSLCPPLHLVIVGLFDAIIGCLLSNILFEPSFLLLHSCTIDSQGPMILAKATTIAVAHYNIVGIV